MTVFAKKQDWFDRSLTKQAVTPMRRYKDLLGPVIDEWPVFPTFHLPTLYKTLRTRLHDEHSWSENKIETFVDDLTGQAEIFEAPYEYELAPSSINTDGARRVMRRLCEEADLELEGKHDYLVPYGGRRGAGEVLVRQRGFTAVVCLLDNIEEVVWKSYLTLKQRKWAKTRVRRSLSMIADVESFLKDSHSAEVNKPHPATRFYRPVEDISEVRVRIASVSMSTAKSMHSSSISKLAVW